MSKYGMFHLFKFSQVYIVLREFLDRSQLQKYLSLQ